MAAVLEAVRRQRGRSKGTFKGLRTLTGQILDDAHGAGRVPVPPESTFNRLVSALVEARELPARPAQGAALQMGPLTPTRMLRPGEMVQVDTTRLDVMAIADDGRPARPELTIAVDVATRSILAAMLRPEGTKAVDAALLLAEMAVPHPMRPGWDQALQLAYAAVPYERLLSLDERLDGAAARPVIVPETIVVDRGKVFVSEAFSAACETLGISVQPAPPRRPTAKGSVERTFGAINTLLAQHVAGYTGSNVTRRGRRVEAEACWTLAQLQELLDEWIICGWQCRPHDALRHPVLPRAVLSPNDMWAALLGLCGYVPLPLSGRDYLQLLPVRWCAITGRGIRIDHRTYDAAVLNAHRGQKSGIAVRGGKWEVHHNPHDLRQVWVRLPDGGLVEVPWIHRDHVHEPFGEDAWRHVKTMVEQRAGRERHEADLAEALDQVLRRARPTPPAIRTTARDDAHRGAAEQQTMQAGSEEADIRAAASAGRKSDCTGHDVVPGGVPGSAVPRQHGDIGAGHAGVEGIEWEEADSLDDLTAEDDQDGEQSGDTRPDGGFALWDAYEEAQRW